jgi:hypothetical protein
MVESTIAQYIADQTDFALTTDIVIHDLDEETREGISIQLDTNFDVDAALSLAEVNLLLYYYDYVIGRGHLDTLTALFNDYRGTINGNWTVGGPVESQFIGKDPMKRYVFSIRVHIYYDKSTL